MSKTSVVVGNRCAAMVWDNFTRYTCPNGAKVNRDGKNWCRVHDPVRRAAVSAKREAKWETERKDRAAVQDVRIAEENVVEAAERIGPNALTEYPFLESALRALIEARRNLDVLRNEPR
jgi:hypothetical protein